MKRRELLKWLAAAPGAMVAVNSVDALPQPIVPVEQPKRAAQVSGVIPKTATRVQLVNVELRRPMLRAPGGPEEFGPRYRATLVMDHSSHERLCAIVNARVHPDAHKHLAWSRWNEFELHTSTILRPVLVDRFRRPVDDIPPGSRVNATVHFGWLVRLHGGPRCIAILDGLQQI